MGKQRVSEGTWCEPDVLGGLWAFGSSSQNTPIWEPRDGNGPPAVTINTSHTNIKHPINTALQTPSPKYYEMSWIKNKTIIYLKKSLILGLTHLLISHIMTLNHINVTETDVGPPEVMWGASKALNVYLLDNEPHIIIKDIRLWLLEVLWLLTSAK